MQDVCWMKVWWFGLVEGQGLHKRGCDVLSPSNKVTSLPPLDEVQVGHLGCSTTRVALGAIHRAFVRFTSCVDVADEDKRDSVMGANPFS